jgi:hypothetical protein
VPYSQYSSDHNIVARITSSTEQLRPMSTTPSPDNDNGNNNGGHSSSVDEELLDIMRVCWSHDPSLRPSAAQLVQRYNTHAHTQNT